MKKYIICLGVGIIIGAIEENLRYSIIYHEAQKGDKRAQEIINQFETVGTRIEEILTK